MPNASPRLLVGSSTDVGLRRAANEDSLIVAHPVYAVADGMGGHDAGDRASQAVVAALQSLAGRVTLTPDDVADAVSTAHSTVRTIADETARGAGSTLTGIVSLPHGGRAHWLVFNIGDSRVYRLRGSELLQLTVDHSIAQQLVDDGTLAREDVATYSGRNVITRAVGADESEADYWLYPVVASDRFVICSDGLTGEVTDEAIRAVLLSTREVQGAADRLVGQALAHGGRDNVTVVVIEVVDGGIDAELDEATGVVSRLGEPVVQDDLDEDTLEVNPRRSNADA
jgi:protein phosphatase